ncbi:MAG: LamG domain-containing protein [Planctomycetes bacterium]|nr:LamG domain-containing protein [Planctomycetota bacterium]
MVICGLGLALAGPAAAAEYLIAFDEGKGDQTTAQGEPPLEGDVVKAQWAEGKKGNALQFNDYGNNLEKPKVSDATFVEFKHHEALVPKAKVSISAWVWVERRGFFYGGIVEKGGGFGAAYRLGLLRNGVVKASVGNELLSVESPKPLSLKEWHELKMIYDGTRLTLAIDGEEVASQEKAVAKFANADRLILGNRFTGKIDEVQIKVE